ncbi:MAG: glycosyltransferase family 2 protein [Xanthomonadales bacterium]|nr:glycosyltransferase family 2 protein [Xanthomonadales bacterium]
MSVTAIVVNYNAGKLLTECVAALVNNGVTDVRVVDNASTDRSLDQLRGQFGRNASVRVLANPTNRGFGRAVNDQLPLVDRESLLIINPDCRLEAGALDALVGALGSDAAIGLAGPAVVDPRGRPEPAACRFFPTPRRAFMSATGLYRLARRVPALAGVENPGACALDRVTRVEATSGACMLLRTAAFREVGGFDEGYALHAEDLDLMRRLQDRGWSVVYVPAARAVHVQGVSSASRPLWVHAQKHRGLSRFYTKHRAAEDGFVTRCFFRAGLWVHWLLLLPVQAWRQWAR